MTQPINSDISSDARCALFIHLSPSLIYSNNPTWVHITIANHTSLSGVIFLEVINSEDALVKTYELESKLQGADVAKAFQIGPLHDPDRYTVRATVKDSGIYAVAFLYVTTVEGEGALPLLKKALGWRMEASHLLNQGSSRGAEIPLRRAAEVYSALGELECASRSWRDLAFLLLFLDEKERAFEGARKSLEDGLWVFDRTTAISFLALVTDLSKKYSEIYSYRSLLYKIFAAVGIDRAYLDAEEIFNLISGEARNLYAQTVFELFPISYDDNWVYIYSAEIVVPRESSDRIEWTARIPNDDQHTSKIMRYVPLETDVESLKKLAGV